MTKVQELKIKCPLGHIQKNRSGHTIIPDVYLRICDVCGIAFDTRIANKEIFKQFNKKKS